jgi:hypothetical protein
MKKEKLVLPSVGEITELTLPDTIETNYGEENVSSGFFDLAKVCEKKPIIKEFRKHNDVLFILGFAPDSLKFAPLDALNADMWALNELYLDRPHIAVRATAWFQLHGYEPPIIRDTHQRHNLGQLNCPILMWRKHPGIHNSVPYPLHDVLRYFDIFGEDMAMDQPDLRQRSYFTNSISWMLALGIMMEYKEIHVYGVNMAQDQEFSHQRPSCEFLMGWARGKGIKIYKPPVSDLLLSPILYGYDDASPFMQKLEARRQELMERIEGTRQQRLQAQEQANQSLQQEQSLLGAMHDCEYIMRIGDPNPILDMFSQPADYKPVVLAQRVESGKESIDSVIEES